MPTARVILKGSYIQAGSVPLPKVLKRYLPGPNEFVDVIDQQDNSYQGKVTGDGARINRLTGWHNRFRTADGVELELSAESDRTLKVTLLDETKLPEPPLGPIQTQASALQFEQDLQDYLAANPHALEPGLKLYGKNAHADTDVGEVDILAQDRSGDLVVVELKAGRATDSAIGQLLGYMNHVKDHLAKGHNVRGLIVASDFSPRLRAATRGIGTVGLKKYNVSFTFSDER